MHGRFIAYYRVSTSRQEASGLGLEGQRQAVATYLNGGKWTLLAEFTEVESGKRNDRPQIAKAIAECKLTGATLVIAKLDRLARNVGFVVGLKNAGIKFVAVDMPDANALTVNILAAVAEAEAEAISARTKAALAAAKAAGAVLGGWRHGPKVDSAAGTKARQAKAAARNAIVRPIIVQMRADGQSLRQIAAALAERGVQTARGGKWTADSVNEILRAA